MTDTNRPTWTVENHTPTTRRTMHRAKLGIWSLLVTEYMDAPKGQRFQARVFRTRGSDMALRHSWCESLDQAKLLCVRLATDPPLL
jgi:hypothetical protein